MSELGITIQGQCFPHLLYHLVLTYSNWESATVCFSESFESLCEGFQNAVWELGKVPQRVSVMHGGRSKLGGRTTTDNAHTVR
jgi:hypothetical protein